MGKRFLKILAAVLAAVTALSAVSCKDDGQKKPQLPEGQYEAAEFFHTPSTDPEGLETADFSIWSAYTTDKIMRHSENEVKFREIYVEAAKGETECSGVLRQR